MNRRDFLKKIIVVAPTVALAPFLLQEAIKPRPPYPNMELVIPQGKGLLHHVNASGNTVAYRQLDEIHFMPEVGIRLKNDVPTYHIYGDNKALQEFEKCLRTLT